MQATCIEGMVREVKVSWKSFRRENKIVFFGGVSKI